MVAARRRGRDVDLPRGRHSWIFGEGGVRASPEDRASARADVQKTQTVTDRVGSVVLLKNAGTGARFGSARASRPQRRLLDDDAVRRAGAAGRAPRVLVHDLVDDERRLRDLRSRGSSRLFAVFARLLGPRFERPGRGAATAGRGGAAAAARISARGRGRAGALARRDPSVCRRSSPACARGPCPSKVAWTCSGRALGVFDLSGVRCDDAGGPQLPRESSGLCPGVLDADSRSSRLRLTGGVL